MHAASMWWIITIFNVSQREVPHGSASERGICSTELVGL